jgi:hypothetical protein
VQRAQAILKDLEEPVARGRDAADAGSPSNAAARSRDHLEIFKAVRSAPKSLSFPPCVCAWVRACMRPVFGPRSEVPPRCHPVAAAMQCTALFRARL